MQVIKLLPGQTVLDISGQEIPVEDFDSLVCFLDEDKEKTLDLLYDQYGEKYINSQLEKGMLVEEEHSDDREMQYTIARDHILEFVNYYDYLEVMEAKMGEESEDILTADASEDTLLESEKKMKEVDYHNKPVAAKGLTSYRYEGPYGFIMIGARDVEDALSEAKRSTSKVDIKNLQVWDARAGAYVPVSLLEKRRS